MVNQSLLLKWAMTFGCAALLLASAGRAESPAQGPLYARMGGFAKVTAVVNDVIDDAASNPRTRRSFADVDIANVKRLLVEQICELAGGGCRYSGDSMHDVHAGLGITQAEFYDLVQVLRDSMVRHGIGLRERNELLKILAPMKRDVVEK